MKFIDLDSQYNAYKEEIDAQMKSVIDNSSFIMGKAVGELEEKLAVYVGVKHAVGCASGTDALLLSLMSFGIEPDDEIITTPFTFIATAEIISLLKAKPVFVDIRDDTYNIDANKIEGAITKKTKGIIAVDLYGQCADYDEINALAQKNNLFVIQDAAQSFGAEYKNKKSCSQADVGCTSFFPAKPLGCFGDGGMIFTDNDQWADNIRSLTLHGKGNEKYDHATIGLNSRLDTIQAAVLLAKFGYYNTEIANRQKIAKIYDEKLTNHVTTPHILDHNLSVYAQYSIRSQQRDNIQSALKEKEIPTAIHYPRPLHLQKAYSFLGHKEGDFPVAEKVSNEIISLPFHPFLKEEDQTIIIDAVCDSVNNTT